MIFTVKLQCDVDYQLRELESEARKKFTCRVDTHSQIANSLQVLSTGHLSLALSLTVFRVFYMHIEEGLHICSYKLNFLYSLSQK